MAKFKAGDRVRAKQDIGRFFTAGRVYEIASGRAGQFILTDNDEADAADAKHHTDDKWLAENFDMAQPLTIRAGGYYKTRDGRKVGPMNHTKSLAYDTRETLLFGDVDGQQKLFREADGRHLFGEKGFDLISEWPAEKGCAAAQVDVQREEYGAPATNAAFKVGDVVRFLRDNPDGGVRYGAKGALARVTKLRGRAGFSGSDIYVTPIGWECDINPGVPSSAVELAPATTAPAIVALIERGQPKPATRPYVHANRDLAAKEAARLADVNNGQEFGVYELVTTRKVERTYEHEWQRLAVKGDKIPAIIALRKFAGINLKAAKDAVESFIDKCQSD